MKNFYFQARERALLGKQYDTLFQQPDTLYRGLTINSMRDTREKISYLLEQANIPVSRSAFCREGRILQNDVEHIGKHPYYHAGLYYVQEPSASAVANLLEVKPGEMVLDLCAAPGGKTAQLAACLQGEGLLVSNEFQKSRVQALKSNLERMGFPNTVILNESTEKIAVHLSQVFDKVLVDAPCSGEGMFRKEPQAEKQHSQALVMQCASLGKEILHHAAQCVKPGGLLCYSTCTFSPEENEMQIDAFLKEHPEFLLIDLSEKVAFGSAGEKSRCPNTEFPIHFTRRIYPVHGGEGHFMALMKKSETGEQTQVAFADFSQNVPVQVQQFLQEYFPSLKNLALHKYHDDYFILPKAPLPSVLQKLNIVRIGVQAGRVEKNRFEPAHALYMAFGAMSTQQEHVTHQEEQTYAWLRGETIAVEAEKKGYTVILCDGFPLGFGKCVNGICKNHYPKGLRNLK